jgi:beta-lactamase regulating signal transducer with metallopeptidase domain
MPWLAWIISNVVLASLLALVAWFVGRRLRRHSIAHILWVLVLVKLVTPPLVSVPLRARPGALACAIGACGCRQHARMPAVVRDTLPWVLLAVWSAGACTSGLVGWRRWRRFNRLTAHAVAAPAEWQSLAERLSVELSIGHAADVLIMPGRLPPLVVPGRRRPHILLPAALLGRLSSSQREAILLHELVHIKRRDHLVRLLELAVRVAYWWLPIEGSIGRQLRNCEEACCDAAVVAHLPRSRREYARLLLDVVDFVAPLPRGSTSQATAMSAVNDLEQRLRAILDVSQASRCKWRAGALAVGLAMAILPFELHYDLFFRPAAPPNAREAAAEATQMPGSDLQFHASLDLCCPS